MTDPAIHWDQLHRDARFRPRYPNDHVVRFLMANKAAFEAAGNKRLLDIGTGAGRHLQAASELGFEPYGIDTSNVGLTYVQQRLAALGLKFGVTRASMLALPFADCTFALVLSFGVFNYGTPQQMQRAIDEAFRVLIPKGKLFAVLRTTEDYRFGKGEQLGPNTFRLKITDTNEYDTVQHFLIEHEVEVYFRKFSRISFEKTETTSANRTRTDSDWLVTADK
ncbi:MAG TPA: class I SAM-dependent methyltransferase [Terriglobales bacterium]|nr:class I SAM-dependent methyltransferase [Terriglobales bacterium]